MICAPLVNVEEYLAITPVVSAAERQTLDIEKLSAHELRLDVLNAKLERVALLEADWDSYGAAVPSKLAISRAEQGLRLSRLLRQLPTTIVPSAEGGLALCWDSHAKHGYIEYANDATVLLALYDRNSEAAVEEISPSLDSVTSAINKIRQYLGA
jgi:hypothetical protein